MRFTAITDYVGITNSRKNGPVPPTQANSPVDIESLGEKKIFMSWRSASRPEKKAFGQKFLRTGIVIGIVVSLLLVIMQEFFLILVVASIIFITYILSSSPVEVTAHEISSHGIKTGETFYYWQELKQFFFTTSSDMEFLAVDTKNKIPGRLFMSFEPAEREHIKELLSQHLLFLEEEPKSFIDRTYYRILDKFDFGGKQ